jgi:hypothetical protein
MQPSTWNDSNQHWIPQFLLKGFGIRRMASRVYELDKQTKAVTVRDVSEAASKTQLLTDQDDKLMRDVEGHAAAAVDAIRKGHLSRIGEDDRHVIDRLVCSMMLNDPYNGSDAEEKREEIIADAVRELSTAVKSYGAELDELDFKNYFDEILGHNWLSGYMDSDSNQGIIAMRLMGLSVFRPPSGRFFIIGDSPVLAVRSTVNGVPSLLNPGSQVILPIHSRCVLAYAWATEMNVVNDGGVLTKEQVRSLNTDYFHGTKCRYIYGRSEETLKQSSLMSLEWTPRERSQDLNRGWSMMLDQQIIRGEQIAARDAAQPYILDSLARELVDTATMESERSESSDSNYPKSAWPNDETIP